METLDSASLLSTLVRSFDQDEFFAELARVLRRRVPYDFLRLTVQPEEDGALQVLFLLFGNQQVLGLPTTLALGDSLPGEAISTGRIVVRGDVSETSPYRDERALARELGVCSALSIPLESRGRYIGTLDLARKDRDAFSVDAIQTASGLAANFAMLVEHAWLLDEHRSLARMDGRRELASEFHDKVIQSLISILLQLEVAQRRLRISPASARADIAEACEMARECLEDGRRIVLNLRPPARHPSALADTLRREVEAFRANGAAATFAVERTPRQLPDNAHDVIDRLSQAIFEQLRSARRIAGIDAVLCYEPVAVSLSISVRCEGFNETAANGFSRSSFAAIKDEAASAGGDLRMTALVGGCTIRLEIPTARQILGPIAARPGGGALGPTGRVMLVDDPSIGFAGAVRTGFRDDGVTEFLTEREEQVLSFIARGHRNKEIAQQLCVTEATVKYHVAHLLMKLGVSSRTEALVKAQSLGLVS